MATRTADSLMLSSNAASACGRSAPPASQGCRISNCFALPSDTQSASRRTREHRICPKTIKGFVRRDRLLIRHLDSWQARVRAGCLERVGNGGVTCSAVRSTSCAQDGSVPVFALTASRIALTQLSVFPCSSGSLVAHELEPNRKLVTCSRLLASRQRMFTGQRARGSTLNESGASDTSPIDANGMAKVALEDT